MSDDELSKKVDLLKKRESRRRAIFKIKIAIYIIIGSGIAFYGFQAYTFGMSLGDPDNTSFEIKKPDRTGFLQYNLNFEVNVKNPTTTTFSVENVDIKKILIEEVKVGSFYKRVVEITPGLNTIPLTIPLDLREHRDIPIKQIISEKEMNVSIEGSVDIPLKVFGVFTWKTITVPFQFSEDMPIQIEPGDRIKFDKLTDLRDKIKENLPEEGSLEERIEEIVEEIRENLPEEGSLEERIEETVEKVKENLPEEGSLEKRIEETVEKVKENLPEEPPVDNDLDNDGYDSVASGGTDCDDSDPAINPGTAEIPGNDVDENCDEIIEPTPEEPTPEEPTPKERIEETVENVKEKIKEKLPIRP